MFYSKDTGQSLQELGADANLGLTSAEAERRLARNGPNKLREAKKKSLFIRVLAQFKDFLVIILIAAAVISVISAAIENNGVLTFGDMKDAIIIVAILVINMIIGITQENKADNALKELKNMSSPKAKVKRDGHIEKIGSENVVSGDIIILEAGDYIPADLRLIESVNLKIDESALTGESVPVEKNAAAVLDSGAVLGDRVNSASMGTVVTYGRGAGVVCATGTDTEMGKIAAILSETDEANTPLQDKLNAMAKMLGAVCIITCAIVFAVGFLYDFLDVGEQRGIIDMLMVSVSLAVAAVPEGVAIVATVILAIGVQKMVRANVIVKKLRAVETLGSTTVICSDKTGTMTQNKMTVADVDSDNIPLMAEISALCNDAVYDKETGKIIGDPTESAMLVYGAAVGADKDKLNAEYKRVHEIPFDSERKMMSVCNIKGSKVVMSTKGAPDAIIRRSAYLYLEGRVVEMTDDIRRGLIARNEQFASRALRVLAFAYKEYDHKTEIDCTEEDLIYVGMMGMIDPPRGEVKSSVEQCREAGITVKMITGDHKITGGAIAKELGIMREGDKVLEGGDIDILSDGELREKVKTVNVFARVTPEHKVRIVAAVKENNNIVAMTGDGVNDAPSLKKADIGIAMGITGTDVSKEAADMILTDDNFVSIVGAVEQGRTIYGNIRKVTGYLLACNIGEILIILLAIIAGLPVPLVATQLLFLNLLTDAFPAFALGLESKEPGVMKKKPRDPKEPIINKSMRGLVAVRAVFMCIGALGAFLYGYFVKDYETAVSMCFFTLVAAELLVSYVCKTDTFVGFNRELFANKFLNISIGLSLLILFAVMYVPFLNDMFTTVWLYPAELGICFAFIAAVLAGSEFSEKFFS
jgi:Ca2+-transporting ATPase